MYQVILLILALCIIFVEPIATNGGESALKKAYKAGSKAHKARIGFVWDLFNKETLSIKWDNNIANEEGWYGLYLVESNGDYRAVDHMLRGQGDGGFLRWSTAVKLTPKWELVYGVDDRLPKYVVVFQPGKYVNDKFVKKGPMLRTKERKFKKEPMVSFNEILIAVAIIGPVCIVCAICMCCLCRRSNSKQQSATDQAQNADVVPV